MKNIVAIVLLLKTMTITLNFTGSNTAQLEWLGTNLVHSSKVWQGPTKIVRMTEVRFYMLDALAVTQPRVSKL